MHQRPVLILLAVALACAPFSRSRAEAPPHIMTAFAMTLPGAPPARIVEYYGQGRPSRIVPQPPADVVRRRAQRS